jgi:hypothetical protein
MSERWNDAMSIVESASKNPARDGQHLDIRIVGPGLSITLLSLDDFRELIARARMTSQFSNGEREA